VKNSVDKPPKTLDLATLQKYYFLVDTGARARVTCGSMTRITKPKEIRINFLVSPEELAIIEAGQQKHGLRKISDVLRMAIRRFAEAEQLKVKAS
jgi:hypothetical protein